MSEIPFSEQSESSSSYRWQSTGGPPNNIENQGLLNLDALSIYEVAVLVFTSPETVAEEAQDQRSIVLTGKEAYLWAGAIAFMLSQYPTFEKEDVRKFLTAAIQQHIRAFRDSSSSVEQHAFPEGDLGRLVISSFLEQAHLFSEENLREISRNTDAAIQSLESGGLIRDPVRKQIGSILLAILLLMPVNFTAKTEKGVIVERQINSMTWSFVEQNKGEYSEINLKWKVKEIASMVANELVPTFVTELGELSKK